jgi:hypothetical protein
MKCKIINCNRSQYAEWSERYCEEHYNEKIRLREKDRIREEARDKK